MSLSKHALLRLLLVAVFAAATLVAFLTFEPTPSAEPPNSQVSAPNDPLSGRSALSTTGEGGAINLNDPIAARASPTAPSPADKRSVLTMQRRASLFKKYELAMQDRSPGAAAAAMDAASRCMNFASGVEPFLPALPAELADKLSSLAKQDVATARSGAISELRSMCDGFTKENLSDLLIAAHKRSVAEGFGFLKHSSSTPIEPTMYEAAVKRLLDWPDRYISVLGMNSVWLATGIEHRFSSLSLTPGESQIVAQLALCRLGADCTGSSVASLDYCAMSGICGHGDYSQSLLLGAKLMGLDDVRLQRLSDQFAEDFRRGDRSVLRF
jgi:hypothetical protein